MTTTNGAPVLEVEGLRIEIEGNARITSIARIRTSSRNERA